MATNPNHELFLRAAGQAILHWSTLNSIVAQVGDDDAKDKALWLSEVVPAWFLDTPEGRLIHAILELKAVLCTR
jgi:hypothetical protein